MFDAVPLVIVGRGKEPVWVHAPFATKARDGANGTLTKKGIAYGSRIYRGSFGVHGV